MATINEYLSKIRSAEYGEEVRGSIHDAISKINEESCSTKRQALDALDAVNETGIKMADTIRTLSDVVEILGTEKDHLYLHNGSFYYFTEGMVKLGDTSYECFQTTYVEVIPGEIYKIVTYSNSSNELFVTDGAYCPPVVLAGSIGDVGAEGPQYASLIAGYEDTAANGENHILVTIPDGCNYLLVNSSDHDMGDIKVFKLEKKESSNMKILWSGLLKGSEDGIPVEFTIPEKCFFSREKELIIAVNGYCPEEDESSYSLCVTGMCFGEPEDFGLAKEDYGPYRYGYFDRTVYMREQSESSHFVHLKICVEKVPDSRYAVCTLKNISEYFYITSVSAIVPK